MFAPQLNETPELKVRQQKLYIVFGIGLILTFIRFFINVQLAVNDLLSFLLFWCGIAYYNYCMLVFFVILTLFSMLSYGMIIGIFVQKQVLLGSTDIGMDGASVFLISMVLITLIYDFYACWLCYDNYKVFKYYTFSGGANRGGIQMDNNQRDPENGNDTFKAFGGKGVTVG